MAADENYRKLDLIFQDVFDDDTISVGPETSARDIPEWDSFNHINLIVAIETEFGIKFSATELEGLKNVGDLVRQIESKRKAAAPV